MVQALKLFFRDYPRQILEMQGVRPGELPAGLMDHLWTIGTGLSPSLRTPKSSGSISMPIG